MTSQFLAGPIKAARAKSLRYTEAQPCDAEDRLASRYAVGVSHPFLG